MNSQVTDLSAWIVPNAPETSTGSVRWMPERSGQRAVQQVKESVSTKLPATPTTR